MSCLTDLLDVMNGGWLRTLGDRSDRSWPQEDDDPVLLAHVLRLGAGQDLEVEQDFIEAHLSFSRASLGGTQADGVPWLLLVQAVPASVDPSAGAYGGADVAVLGELVDILDYNHEAEVIASRELGRVWLLADYCEAGTDPQLLTGWSTRDLLRGEIAEVAGFELGRVVAGYPECAFPGRTHRCEHDVFDDVFEAWRRGELGGLEDG